MQPVIHRSERVCIDISDNVVSIIKLDPEGIMMRAGSAKAPTMPQQPNDAYVTDLSKAIRNAAWAAKVSMGFGASCIVVSGGPEMVIQRFTWPDMPTEALNAIVQEEMIPYLPGNPSHFTISCEVLRREEGSGPPMLEVIAAAMPIELSAAITTACRWANFKPKRVELRENARGRFAHYWCAPVEGEIPQTYAILDIGPGLANIAFYHKGLFHSNRYFTPEIVKLGEVKDFDLLMTVKAGGIDDNENAIRYDPLKLTEDIVSAISHFNRSTDGAGISCVLLMDDENIPGVDENLRTQLREPILKPSQWVTPGIKRPNLRRIDQAQFLDAFAAGMPSISGHEGRMDLRMTDQPAQKSGHSLAQHKEQPEAVHAPFMAANPVHSPQPPVDDMIVPSEPYGYDNYGYSSPAYPEPSSAYDMPNQPSYDYDYDIPITHDTRSYSDYDKPLQSGPVNLPEMPSQSRTRPHEVPFDTISAKKTDHTGFPFAIPEDSSPEPGSKKPIIMAAIVAAAILLIVVLASMFAPLPTPMAEAREYQAKLDTLNNEIASLVPSQVLFVLQQERENMYRDISAINWSIDHLNERMAIVREFYMYPPALLVISEILHTAEVGGIESIESRQQLVISGRNTPGSLPALGAAIQALRRSYLFNDFIQLAGVDAGSETYSIILELEPGEPFWMNNYVERRWQ